LNSTDAVGSDQSTSPGLEADEQRLAAWVERTLGGRVERMTRLARWRPAWDIDFVLDGQLIPLHARGDREANFAIPIRIADERPMHDLLEKHGLPVPHAHGLCDDPYVLVMDRLAGNVDLTFADSDAVRKKLIEDYLRLLPAIYSISMEEVAAHGIPCPRNPADPEEVALGALLRWEQVYDRLITRPDPIATFLRRWLHRNAPKHRAVARFITFDAFQFMFEGDAITGLLDFELAHVGDPMMDLAALRIRDTIKHLGDLSEISVRFEELTGETVDHDVVDYHTVLYNALTVLAAGPAIVAPVESTDHVSHQAWYVNSARWAFETIAEICGYELEPVNEPETIASSHAPTFAHLTRGIRSLKTATADDAYRQKSLHWVARHLQRVDEIGTPIAQANLEDLAQLLGHRPDADRADAELIRFITDADASHDEALVRLLDARAQRAHLLLGPSGSLMLRHPRLRSLRRDATQDPLGGREGWPAGSIAGTQ
jgi:Phosphotransferase enzyme family